jgi:hypothetical protein
MRNSLAKADLYLHSKASNLPSGWFSKLIGCPESFTEPMEIYGDRPPAGGLHKL